jgi:hypothetical protein
VKLTLAKSTMAKSKSNKLGVWAFIIGVIAAVVLGLLGGTLGAQWQQWLAILLVVIGIVVGLLNVTSDETMGFLTTAAILVFVSYAGSQAMAVAGQWAVNVFQALMLLFVPATIIVALRALWTLARD